MRLEPAPKNLRGATAARSIEGVTQGVLAGSRSARDHTLELVKDLSPLIRRVPLGLGALMTLLLLGAIGLSQLLQERMARHLVDKVLESQKIKIRDRVTTFDSTLQIGRAHV